MGFLYKYEESDEEWLETERAYTLGIQRRMESYGSENGILARNLTRLRLLRGLSTADMAQQAALQPSHYESLENIDFVDLDGSVLSTLQKILNVKAEELVRNNPIPSSVRFHSKIPIIQREEVLVQIANALRDYDSLERITGRRIICYFDPLKDCNQKEVALEAANFFGFKTGGGYSSWDDDEIYDIPHMLPKNGVRIIDWISFPYDDFKSLSISDPNEGGPAIVINDRIKMKDTDKNIAALNELGALILHPEVFDYKNSYNPKQVLTDTHFFANEFISACNLDSSCWGRSNYKSLVESALDNESISQSRAAELLGMSLSDFRDIYRYR